MNYIVKRELIDDQLTYSLIKITELNKKVDDLSIDGMKNLIGVPSRLKEFRLKLAKEEGKVELLQYMCSESKLAPEYEVM